MERKEEEEFFFFMMPPSIWSKKPSPSRFKMTIEYAAERYPDATPILSSREVRAPLSTIPADAPYAGRRQKTPAEEKYQEWLISRIGRRSEDEDNQPNEPS
ncbi:hypothetical protein [Variovorax sp. V15]|uniref:hypothetical protein n=1 Tax=Variovorax sp. V15 TaxID=3065952 RepID=UPI0034E8E283